MLLNVDQTHPSDHGATCGPEADAPRPENEGDILAPGQQVDGQEAIADTVVEPETNEEETTVQLTEEGEEGSSTIPWGNTGAESIDPVTLAEIDAFAQQLELEYQALEQHEQEQGQGGQGFDRFLVAKAEGFLRDHIPPEPKDKQNYEDYHKSKQNGED